MDGTQDEADEPVNDSLPLRIRPEAEQEIEEAYQYYEDKARGLGMEFLRALDSCLSAVERHPEMYPTVYKQIKRGVLRRFPYSLFYKIEPTHISVIACFHASRDPEQWRRRS